MTVQYSDVVKNAKLDAWVFSEIAGTAGSRYAKQHPAQGYGNTIYYRFFYQYPQPYLIF